MCSVARGGVHNAGVSDSVAHASPRTQSYPGSGHPPPLSSYAAHFITYYWLYAEEDHDKMVLATRQVKELMNNDKEHVEEYANTVVSSCGTDVPNYLARKAIKLLSDDRVIGHDAVCLIALCHTFMLIEPERYCNGRAPGKPCLILHLMSACRRQICSSSELFYSEIFVMSTLQIFQYVAFVA